MTWEDWKGFTFGQPWWLLGLLLLPLLAWLQGGRRPAPAIRFSTVAPLRAVGRRKPAGWGGFGRPLLFLGLALLITALARPRLGKSFDVVESSGVDIMLALDVSRSMESRDFVLDGDQVSRTDAVKLVARRFIQARPNDRIGLVIFSANPFMASPATLDHEWLLSNVDRLEANMLNENGTCIASAIASAASRLDSNKNAKSKILILLTDGAQNVGKEDPAQTAAAAAKLGIKFYAIGAGSDRRMENVSPLDLFQNGPVFSFEPGDEAALRKMAEAAKGTFFRAADTKSLARVFDQIDKMEKTEVKLQHKMQWRELFDWFIGAGAAVLVLRSLLALTVWRTVP